MSNQQWHDDQSAGERALRDHARLVQAAPDLLKALLGYATAVNAVVEVDGRAAYRVTVTPDRADAARAALNKAFGGRPWHE
jgi:hypothetical protein